MRFYNLNPVSVSSLPRNPSGRDKSRPYRKVHAPVSRNHSKPSSPIFFLPSYPPTFLPSVFPLGKNPPPVRLTAWKEKSRIYGKQDQR